MSLLDTLRNDWDHLMAEHGPELEHALSVAAAVADNPVAQMVLGLAHIPGSSMEVLGRVLQQLEADFAKLMPAKAGDVYSTPDPTATAAAQETSSADSASALPAERSTSDPDPTAGDAPALSATAADASAPATVPTATPEVASWQLQQAQQDAGSS